MSRETWGYHPTEGARIFTDGNLPAGWFDTPAGFQVSAPEPVAPAPAPVITDDEREQIRVYVHDLNDALLAANAKVVDLADSLAAAQELAVASAARAVAAEARVIQLEADMEALTAPSGDVPIVEPATEPAQPDPADPNAPAVA